MRADPVNNALSLLSEAGSIRRLVSGQAAYRQGDEPDGLFVVVAGELRLTGYSASGRRYLLRIHGPGDWFGELSTLDGAARQQDATARGGATVRHIPLRDVERIGRDCPEVWRAIGALAAANHRAMLAYAEIVLMAGSEQRVVALLNGVSAGRAGPLRITREEIANDVGVSRQTAHVILHRLQARGVLRLGYGKVELLRPE